MRVGRYSPVPGSDFELPGSDFELPGSDFAIPYYAESITPRPRKGPPPGGRHGLGRCSFRRSRTLAFVGVFLVLIFYLGTHHKRKHNDYDAVDWSLYAYSQYATDGAYLCNSLMVFEALHRLGSRADRILFYPDTWDLRVAHKFDRDSQLLALARDQYDVKLIPVEIPTVKDDARHVINGKPRPADSETWDRSFAKLLAFGETQYDRIVHIDSDVTVLRNMDDLFLLPSTAVAMPRAYWSEQQPVPFTSLVIVLQPSASELQALQNASSARTPGVQKYDMELMNERFGNSALVLPHQQFLLTGEFRKSIHSAYFGNDYEEWDPDKAVEEARLIHFSDWPLPKPWIMWPNEGMRMLRPKCKIKPGTAEESGCRDREVWMELYDDFRRRRKEVCKLLSVPAPDWPPKGLNLTGE